jgi:hypothetical protein
MNQPSKTAASAPSWFFSPQAPALCSPRTSGEITKCFVNILNRQALLKNSDYSDKLNLFDSTICPDPS